MQLHFRKKSLLRRLAAVMLSACLMTGLAQAAPAEASSETTTAAAAQTSPATDYLPVLMYHHFDEDPGGSTMVVSPERFAEQMAALKQAGYTAVTPEQIVDYVDNGTPLPEKPVWISMDDGYQSNLTYAAPVLQKNGLNATIYCIGVSVGKSTYKDFGVPIIPHFSYEEAKKWVDAGVINIQNHTYDMHNVSGLDVDGYRRGVLPRPDESLDSYMTTFRNDFHKANDAIHAAFGYDTLAFAYPFGLHNAVTEGMLQIMGVRLTVTIREAINTLVMGDPSCLYSMTRFNITDDVTGAQLLEKIKEPVK